ncbi:MAG: O-acetylserine lyase, partial [Kofleriaceae bacterium]
LDSVAYQKDNRGGLIRAALTARTQVATIPQVFVGGQLVGGATDVLGAWKAGTLQKQLAASNVRFDDGGGIDPFSFLPTWLQPR